ncbi:hypothetical protein GCM10027262_15450 [Nocardia tengchongensis]
MTAEHSAAPGENEPAVTVVDPAATPGAAENTGGVEATSTGEQNGAEETTGADAGDTEGSGETGRAAHSVVLVGPPGAGKSTIGRKLARELGVELYDTDAGIEERTGRTIPEIFAEDGEPEFRRIEEEVVRDAVLAGHGVVSLGGGSVLSAATRELLRGRTVIYLEISVGEGLRRTGASTNRPLLNGDDPAKKYRELMKTRRPLYREVATIRVRTDGRSPGRVVRMILAKLGVEPTERPEDPATEPTPAEPATTSRSRARRKRRRGRGRSENAATATPESTTATADSSDPERNGRGSGDRSNETADGADGTKRGRRNRRSRRRGGRTAETGSATTASATTPASTRTPVSMTTTATDASDKRGGRRRRAARAAGAPGQSAGGTHDSSSATPARGSEIAAASTARPDTPAAQPDSNGGPGAAAAPGNGRSRRARARRARARAREHDDAGHGAPNGSDPSTTPPAPEGVS